MNSPVAVGIARKRAGMRRSDSMLVGSGELSSHWRIAGKRSMRRPSTSMPSSRLNQSFFSSSGSTVAYQGPSPPAATRYGYVESISTRKPWVLSSGIADAANEHHACAPPSEGST
jgi:hypothetical protein